MNGALNIMWTAEAWDDYFYWQSQDKKTLSALINLSKRCSARRSKASVSLSR